MAGVLIKRGNLDTETHTRRRPCEDEGRDWGDASISKEQTPKLASKPPEAKREAWNRVSLAALRKNQPCQHLDLGVLMFGTVRQSISIVH